MSDAQRLIEEALRHAGISAAEAARRSGVAPEMVSRWRNGHTDPQTAGLSALLLACGLRLTTASADGDVYDPIRLGC